MDLKKIIVGEKFIQRHYGFELTWNEKMALSHYIECFGKEIKRCKEIGLKHSKFSDGAGLHEAIFKFLDDYFGIPVRDLEKTSVRIRSCNRIVWQDFGLGLDDHPNFKDYCKLKVQEWRDERTLL